MIKIDPGNIRAISRALKDTPKRIGVVLGHVLNGAASKSRTIIARDVAAKVGQKVGVVKSMLPLTRASAKRLRAEIGMRSTAPPAITVDPKAIQDAAGTTYKIKGRKQVFIPGAFLATMPSGHRGIFYRAGSARKGGAYRTPSSAGDSRWSADYQKRKSYFAKRRDGRLKILEAKGPAIPTLIVERYRSDYQPVVKQQLKEAGPKAIKRELQRQARKANRARK